MNPMLIRTARSKSIPSCNQALNEALDELLVEAFAVVREGGRRVSQHAPLRVQLIGGMVLHEGQDRRNERPAKQDSGCDSPRMYLNALGGRGVHVVTVNDYLAKRDSEVWASSTKFSGPERRRHRSRSRRRRAPRSL